MASVALIDSLINKIDPHLVVMTVIGVCGGISSGKSSLCKILKDAYNFEVINADKIGHEVLGYSSVIDKIVGTFGDKVLKDKDDNKTSNDNDNDKREIDRRKLGAIVFSDKSKMNQLNDIMWPIIGEKIVKMIKEFKDNKANKDKKNKFLFIEAAVLIEAKWHELNVFDEIWITIASKDIACSRLMKRDNLTEQQAMDRINIQINNKDKLSILDNAKDKNFENYVVFENDKNGLEEFNKIIDDNVKLLKARYNLNK